MMLQEELLAAAAGAGQFAAEMKLISSLMRAKPVQGGAILLSAAQRDRLCSWLDQAAEIIDELSMAAQLDAEDAATEGL